MYGKLSDIVGRKPILFFSIGIFLFGSAMCGAAQSFIWLALCKQCLVSGNLLSVLIGYASQAVECRELEAGALCR